MPSGSDSSGLQCIRRAALNCLASWFSYRELDIHCRFIWEGTLDVSFASLPGLIRTVDEPEKSRTVWPRSRSFGGLELESLELSIERPQGFERRTDVLKVQEVLAISCRAAGIIGGYQKRLRSLLMGLYKQYMYI
jgi:hypothetical protein